MSSKVPKWETAKERRRNGWALKAFLIDNGTVSNIFPIEIGSQLIVQSLYITIFQNIENSI